MNVRCGGCQTVYRVDPAKVPPAGVKARCSMCGGVFTVAAQAEAAEAARPVVAQSPGVQTRPSQPGGAAGTPAMPRPSHVAPGSGPTRGPLPQRPRPSISQPVSPAVRGPAAFPAPAVEPARPRPPIEPAQAPPPVEPAIPAAPEPTFPDVSGIPEVVSPAVEPLEPGPPVEPIAAPPPEPLVRPEPVVEPSVAEVPVAAPLAAEVPVVEPSVAEPPVAEPPPAAPVEKPSAPINPFLVRDPKQKARRLARALISDMMVYHPDKRREGLDKGNLKELFEDEIAKSWGEYVEQVGEEMANSTPFFNEALNDLLAGGQEVF